MGTQSPYFLFQKLAKFNQHIMFLLCDKGFCPVLKLVFLWVVDKIPHSDADYLAELSKYARFLKEPFIHRGFFFRLEVLGFLYPFSLKPGAQILESFYGRCSFNIQKKDILQVTEKLCHRLYCYVCKTPYKLISGIKEIFSLLMLPFTKTNFLSNT